MKRLACFIKNEKLLERLRTFCEAEHLELVDLGTSSFEYDVSYVCFITDTVDGHDVSDLRDVPACFIGSRDMGGPFFRFYMAENFTEVHLRYLVDSIYHGTFLDTNLGAYELAHFHKKYRVENDLFNVDRLACAITRELIYFVSFTALEKIRIGLAEMLTNAIEHGNFRITGAEKLEATEQGTYYDLIGERSRNPEYSNSHVEVETIYSDGELKVVIRDQGTGFDVSEIPDPTDIDRLMRLHGRGILITRMYFNEVRYNSTGNEVTLVKRLT